MVLRHLRMMIQLHINDTHCHPLRKKIERLVENERVLNKNLPYLQSILNSCLIKSHKSVNVVFWSTTNSNELGSRSDKIYNRRSFSCNAGPNFKHSWVLLSLKLISPTLSWSYTMQRKSSLSTEIFLEKKQKLTYEEYVQRRDDCQWIDDTYLALMINRMLRSPSISLLRLTKWMQIGFLSSTGKRNSRLCFHNYKSSVWYNSDRYCF